MKYNLKELIAHHNIIGITSDSRKVRPGDIFFAIRGNVTDGNNYIQEAINNGARFVLTDALDKQRLNDNTKVLFTDNIRQVISEAATMLYPKLPKYLIAVTGTNGKTSTCSYVQQLFKLLGKESASIGTLGVYCSNEELTKHFDHAEYKNLTTLDQISLRKALSALAMHNIDYVSLEASSHGLDQGRLQGLKFTAAGFTSFSQDHLDYHQNMEEYLAAKLKLFTENLSEQSVAVINNQIHEFEYISSYLSNHNRKIITVGKAANIEIKQINSNIQGQSITFCYDNSNNIYNFSTNIIGEFQVYNILTAIALVIKCGFKLEDIIPFLSKLKAPKGRLERATNPQDPYHIFIDYAHTPEALEKSLIELKKIKNNQGELKVVFGCGGDRDISKRSIMGKIAQNLADDVIITDDNPRTEDSAAIRAQIKQGATRAKEIGDRKEAIETTILGLNKDDILLIAGKGHEEYQIIGSNKIEFSDMKVAQSLLKQINNL